jgi:hypothetical protein
MEELRKLVQELEDRHQQLEKESTEVYKKLEEAHDKLYSEELKNINDDIPYYSKKLDRIKMFVEMFKKESHDTCVHYAFQKVEHPYKGDFHEVIQDPLDYLIGEYDCLGMTKFLEIVFEYHNDSVKRFVEQWMETNMEYAEPYAEMKHLYNQFFSKK